MTSEIISDAIPALSSNLLPDPSSDSLVADSQSSSEHADDTSGDSDTTSGWFRPRCWPPKVLDITFPEVTISASTETGQTESSIKVPLQRSYTGRSPIIPSSLADTPCATLGIQGILDKLNATLRTSYTLDTPSLPSILEDCIEKNYNFGTAYGRLRRIWYSDDWSNIRDELRGRKEKDRKMRREALSDNLIIDPQLPPRRVWDLYSNRVVPMWVSKDDGAREWPRPISHAWVDEKDRVDVWTPINGKEWPVAIPKGASLDLIRIEMLNLELQYMWLDVLCLRQTEKGGPKEDLRMEEWKLDVPTIGMMYKDRRVVVYPSGLGLPLHLKEGYRESDRCWFRRAWTLQEVGERRKIIAGDTVDELIFNTESSRTGRETRSQMQIWLNFGCTWGAWDLFGPLGDMRRRVSTNPVDKVAGLAFPLFPQTIPAYNESETLEDAWTALVDSMFAGMRLSFLLYYPGVGIGPKKWRPTWEQVMTEPLPESHACIGFVDRNDETDEDWINGPCIEKGFVRGLDAELAEGGDRCGELVVESADGMQHTFAIRANHPFPIPEDTYTLLGGDECVACKDTDVMRRRFWAVGRRLPGQRFEKVSIVMMDERREVNRMKLLEDLGIARESRNVLV